MQKTENGVLFSAGDLVNFMGCAHATKLDLRQLVAPVELPADDDQARLLQDLGLEHERRFLERLRSEGRSIIEIDGDGDIVEKAERTRAALREGPDVIFQGAFLDQRWQGYSDFLLKVDAPRGSAPFPTKSPTRNCHVRRVPSISCRCASIPNCSRGSRVSHRATCMWFSAMAISPRFGWTL